MHLSHIAGVERVDNVLPLACVCAAINASNREMQVAAQALYKIQTLCAAAA